ncbi:MAG TPA: von Willebrand factor type A domain-containing protein [Thermoanaerobaculia bacterium]
MNPNRKAEIQRKLTMASVPKPPAGLAERIKADIPKHLHAVEEKPNRFSRSLAFNLRVAASILVVVGSLVVAMRVMRENPQMVMDSARPAPQLQKSAAPSAAGNAAPASPTAPAPIAPSPQTVMDELRVDITETTSGPVATAASSASAPEAEAAPARAVARLAQNEPQQAATATFATREEAADSAFILENMNAAGAPVAGASTAAAAPPPPPQPEPAPVPPPAAAPQEPVMKQSAPRERGGLIASAHAAEFSLAARDEVFGISVSPANFREVKSTIENGARPSAEQVNVDALVNYFAGGAKDSKRPVRLEVEASRSPTLQNRYILRFTIDTAQKKLERGASAPPIATDAKVEINIDSRYITNIHRLGGGEELMAKEPTLLTNTSVTALFEVELSPAIPPSRRAATVKLTYRSVADGKLKSATEEVNVSEFRRGWSDATMRHRRASLGAVWAATLKSGTGAPEVARQAEELATQAPKDARARELATLATASADDGF